MRISDWISDVCSSDLLDDLADVADAGARRGVHLEDIGMPVFRYRFTVVADAAGLDGRVALAVRPGEVQRPGDDTRGGGLADAAYAGEAEGLGDAPGGDGVGERAHQRVLADRIGRAHV